MGFVAEAKIKYISYYKAQYHICASQSLVYIFWRNVHSDLLLISFTILHLKSVHFPTSSPTQALSIFFIFSNLVN